MFTIQLFVLGPEKVLMVLEIYGHTILHSFWMRPLRTQPSFLFFLGWWGIGGWYKVLRRAKRTMAAGYAFVGLTSEMKANFQILKTLLPNFFDHDGIPLDICNKCKVALVAPHVCNKFFIMPVWSTRPSLARLLEAPR